MPTGFEIVIVWQNRYARLGSLPSKQFHNVSKETIRSFRQKL
jgi:hypothetical protein